MFHDLNYSLDTDGETRIALGDIYAEISDTSRTWPAGTTKAAMREFVFDCVANEHKDSDPEASRQADHAARPQHEHGLPLL